MSGIARRLGTSAAKFADRLQASSAKIPATAAASKAEGYKYAISKLRELPAGIEADLTALGGFKKPIAEYTVSDLNKIGKFGALVLSGYYIGVMVGRGAISGYDLKEEHH